MTSAPALASAPRSADVPGERGSVILLSLTAFLSAFLLFQVQLIIAKYILPWWGGTPGVWATCMVFFQVLLLAGYAYAHWGSARQHSQQTRLHAALLTSMLAVMALLAIRWPSPITPGPSWKPSTPDFPAPHILLLLMASIGLPFFLLSATAPLTQLWLSKLRPGSSPYWLYALSNFGSLLGLLSYPFVVEPYTRLHTQAWMWSGGFALFVLACLGSMARVSKTTPWRAGAAGNPPSESRAATSSGFSMTEVTRSQRWLWFLLAACASVMLLATTNVITQEVAVIPFLWVAPLCIYLISFILCFESDRWYRRRLFHVLLIGASCLACYVLPRIVNVVSVPNQLMAFSAVLFVLCMVCHGELARLKPPPARLTSFYLTISAGGAAGGAFVSLLAPAIFPTFWEYNIGLVGCGILLLWVLWRDANSWLRAAPLRLAAVFAVALLAEAGYLADWARHEFRASIVTSRNFYGEFVVKDDRDNGPEYRANLLLHAGVTHGEQFRDPRYRHWPTTYYSEDSGVGIAIMNHPRRLNPDPKQQNLRIGVIGLGAGTIAAYGKAGDSIRFYEINPEVTRLSEGKNPVFTYLADSAAQISVVAGDARISLEREAANHELQNFDLLAVDAFNSDAIPVHLLTEEAFALYLKHLKPEGLLAIHISNGALNLAPVVEELGERFKLERAVFNSPTVGLFDSQAEWVILSRDKTFFQQPLIAARADQNVDFRPIPLWTDDYSNLFRLLKKRDRNQAIPVKAPPPGWIQAR